MSAQQFRIGQVCKELREEFPDVSISKLRFLEDRGLVRPERTAGGYRMYTAEHVRQLRHILRMQRDEFLPLKVIRDELTKRMSEGRKSGAGRGVGGRRVKLSDPVRTMTGDDLCNQLGVTREFIAECMQYDLVAGSRANGGTDVAFTETECAIIATAARLARFGIDGRHLKQVRSAVGRHVALAEQFAAAPLRAKNADARAAALRNLETLTTLIDDFMGQVFVNDVREIAAQALAQGPAGGVQSDAVTTIQQG